MCSYYAKHSTANNLRPLFIFCDYLYNAPYSHGAFMAAVQYNSISE
nr:MAG TPA: hypothetical protein [Caudoviricetes sp.]